MPSPPPGLHAGATPRRALRHGHPGLSSSYQDKSYVSPPELADRGHFHLSSFHLGTVSPQETARERGRVPRLPIVSGPPPVAHSPQGRL